MKLVFDSSDVDSYLTRLLSGMNAGYEPVLHEVAGVVSHEIDRQFLQSGDPSWPPLSERTIHEREEKIKRGQSPVAGIETPERFTDTLRLASTATDTSVHGSGFEIDPHSVTVGVDGDAITYAARAMGLDDDPNIPERNPFILSASEESEIMTRLEKDFDKRLNYK